MITADSMKDLTTRMTQMQGKMQMQQKELKQALAEVEDLLSKMTPEIIDEVANIFPDATILHNLSVEDLCKNTNGCNETLVNLIDEMYEFLDDRLNELEELI